MNGFKNCGAQNPDALQEFREGRIHGRLYAIQKLSHCLKDGEPNWDAAFDLFYGEICRSDSPGARAQMRAMAEANSTMAYGRPIAAPALLGSLRNAPLNALRDWAELSCEDIIEGLRHQLVCPDGPGFAKSPLLPDQLRAFTARIPEDTQAYWEGRPYVLGQIAGMLAYLGLQGTIRSLADAYSGLSPDAAIRQHRAYMGKIAACIAAVAIAAAACAIQAAGEAAPLPPHAFSGFLPLVVSIAAACCANAFLPDPQRLAEAWKSGGSIAGTAALAAPADKPGRAILQQCRRMMRNRTAGQRRSWYKAALYSFDRAKSYGSQLYFSAGDCREASNYGLDCLLRHFARLLQGRSTVPRRQSAMPVHLRACALAIASNSLKRVQNSHSFGDPKRIQSALKHISPHSSRAQEQICACLKSRLRPDFATPLPPQLYPILGAACAATHAAWTSGADMAASIAALCIAFYAAFERSDPCLGEYEDGPARLIVDTADIAALVALAWAEIAQNTDEEEK